MIQRNKCIVFDVDGTICPVKAVGQEYDDVMPDVAFVDKMRSYKEEGFYIILATSRNMNTFDGNVGLLVSRTAKQLMAWLDRHNIPYDELYVGKPWPGHDGFYVDDRAVRPAEFMALDFAQITQLLIK